MRITRPSPETIAAWMEAPSMPDAARRAEERQAATLHRAENTAAALDLVAQHFGQSMAETRRGLTCHDLEHETAKVIARYARQEAARLLHDDEEPPEGDSVFHRSLRASYDRLKAERDAREEAASDALLDRQRDDAPARRRPAR